MTNSAAHLLRQARTGAGMSQTDVARRAKVAQSVISSYEAGHRDPALSTLAKLIAATGHELAVDLQPLSPRQRGLPDTPMGRRLRWNRRKILAIAERFGASNVRVFGSVARGEDTDESDFDLLVDLRPGVGLLALGGMARELSDLLRRPVDVVPADSLKPRVRDAVRQETIAL